MRRALFAVLALSAVAAAAPVEESKIVKAPTPSQTIAGFVRYKAPAEWKVEEYANGGGADPVVAFVDAIDRITVRIYGAPGSAYKNPVAFLAGPAASTMGVKPEKVGSVTVAGRDLILYRHGIPVNLGDPHAPSETPMLGREVFLILPGTKGRFIVLSYARESPAPDLERRGEKTWEAFLKTVKLAGRKT